MNSAFKFFNIFGIAILGTFVILCTNGLTISGITAFDTTLIEEFSWTKSELKFRDFLNLVCAAAIVPFVGILIDKYGVKKVMSFGLILLTMLIYSYSYIESYIHMYFIHVGFAFAVASAGTMPVIIMVSQRVKEMRGTALGIALAGTSLGGLLISKLAVYLLNNYGWRMSFRYEAILPIIALILVLVFLKPINYSNKDKNAKTGLTEIGFLQAIKSSTFWAICGAGFFCFYSVLGIIGNMFLYLSELGYSPEKASTMFGALFIIILSAKFSSGFLTEFIPKYLLFRLQLCLMLLGAIFLSINTTQFAWPAIIAVGFGWGGLYTLFNYVIITTFGVKNAGKINGIISTFESIGGGLGIWMTGLISDKTGSYTASFYVVIAFLFTSLIISIFIKPVIADEN